MKAAQIDEYGDASAVKLKEVAKPEVKPGQVLVEVHASSLNPFDSGVLAGRFKDGMHLPATLGGDIAGVMKALGDGVDGFQDGDKVWGQSYSIAGDSGAWAEYAATASGKVGRMPENLDFEQAASLVLVGVSALQALTEGLELHAGQKILINGGAGGIGSVAVQMARYLGAHVTATANSADTEYVRGLGADEVIDYQVQDFTQSLKDYDALLETVRSEDLNGGLTILKSGGRAVSMVGPFDEDRASELGVTANGQGTQVTTGRLDKLRELVEQEAVKPQVGRVFALEDIQEALRAREAGGIRGKIVIKTK
jgi:alcohol dehydrogenase